MASKDDDTPAKAEGRWLTREKLVLAIIVPVLLAVLSAVLAWWPNRPTTDIEVVGLSVVPGEFGDGDEIVPPKVQVAVRNVGDQVSVVSGAQIEILDYAHLQVCEAGGVLNVSASYDVVLPFDPEPGEVIEVDLAQEIERDRADRFEFSMQTPDVDLALGTYLYRLEVTLIRDGDNPLPAGVAIVAAPLFNVPPLTNEDLEYPGEVGDCYRQLAREWERVQAWEGEASPDIPDGELFRG